jgi:hypothetical protein
MFDVQNDSTATALPNRLTVQHPADLCPLPSVFRLFP